MLRFFCLLLNFSLLLVIVSCEPEPDLPNSGDTAPRARLTASPYRGDSTVLFVLNASGSTDRQEVKLMLEYRWDLNGDSLWDTGFTSAAYHLLRFPEPGIHFVQVEVRDRFGHSDTTSVSVTTWGINRDTGHLIDPRDGQRYKTARIKGVWWMAENLNFGTMIPDTMLATDNEVYEKYCRGNDPETRGEFGGYYTYYHWDELMDYDTLAVQGLCPPGWRIPEASDWDTLMSPFSGKGLVSYFAENGYSNLNLTRIGIHELTKFWEPLDIGHSTGYWMYFTRSYSKEYYRGKYIPCPYLRSSWYFYKGNDNGALIRFVGDSIRKYGGALPVRCIK